MSASISYEDIKYTLEDNILTFKKLKEKLILYVGKMMNILKFHLMQNTYNNSFVNIMMILKMYFLFTIV
jgi:hypothetical protein